MRWVGAGGGGTFVFLPLKTSSPVKVEGTAGSCLFAGCRWLCWPPGACCSKVPRPLAVFSSLRPCYLFTCSTTCSNISPSLSLALLFLPKQCSILLCLELQRVCDALPSIVSGTDTLMLVKLLSWVCQGLLMLSTGKSVRLHYLVVVIWLNRAALRITGESPLLCCNLLLKHVF